MTDGIDAAGASTPVFDADDIWSGSSMGEDPFGDESDHSGSAFARTLAEARSATTAPVAPSATSAAGSALHLSGFAAGTQPQAHDLTFARLSADVYDDKGTGADGWRRLSSDQIQQLGLESTAFQDDKAHFKAAIYSDGQGHYAVAFRGTEPTNLQDWMTDLRQGSGHQTRAYRDAVTLGQQISGILGADNVVMVGHSLGGGLADAAALKGGISAVTFNAAGLSDPTIREAGWQPSQGRAAMAEASRSYSVAGEILSLAQDHSGGILPTALGQRVWLADPEPDSHPDPSPMYQPGGEAYGLVVAGEHSVWLHGTPSVLESLARDPRVVH